MRYFVFIFFDLTRVPSTVKVAHVRLRPYVSLLLGVLRRVVGPGRCTAR